MSASEIMDLTRKAIIDYQMIANEDGIRILDPEFAFYGPMGYDIGNVIGNLFFSWANKFYTMPKEAEAISNLERTIAELCDLTMSKLAAKYDKMVSFSLYRTEAFRQAYLAGVLADSIGYAGTEIIRRVVGDSKVAEITSVNEPAQRLPMERALLKLGITLIKQRECLQSGSDIVNAFQLILS